MAITANKGLSMVDNPKRLVSNVALHHFCHTLYIKSKLTGPVYSKWKKLIREHEGKGRTSLKPA